MLRLRISTLVLALGVLFSPTPARAQTAPRWVAAYNGNELDPHLVVDAQGNTYVAGIEQSAATGQDWVLMFPGALLWSRVYNGPDQMGVGAGRIECPHPVIRRPTPEARERGQVPSL